MTQPVDATQINSLIANATPDELVAISKSVFGRVSQLDTSAQERFTKSIMADQSTSKLINPQPVN